MWFGQRVDLQARYLEWLDKNPEIKDCPFNVISFLAINNLLDEDAVMKYLNNEEEIKED